MTIPDELGSYRRWALPVLRALQAMGGKGTPSVVEDRVRVLLKNHLNDLQSTSWSSMCVERMSRCGALRPRPSRNA